MSPEEVDVVDRDRRIAELEAALATANRQMLDLHKAASATAEENAKLEAEIARLESWSGLLSILDKHYPEENFAASQDPGAVIVRLTRELDKSRQERDAGIIMNIQMTTTTLPDSTIVQHIREWAASPEGREALRKIIADSERQREAAQKAREVDPESLRRPCTI